MSRIAEYFGGVVAEILGDGLLVYWNTPLDLEEMMGLREFLE